MKVLFKVDEEGNGYVAALESANPGETVAEHRKSANVGKGQEIELDLADLVSADQIGFGNVVDSGTGDVVSETPGSETGQSPADTPAGGNEGSSVEGQDQGTVDESAGGKEPEAPADQVGANEPATSAASEKPLYKIEGEEIPMRGDGAKFVPSGLETPDGATLYHFEGDTEGQAATGNVDGVSVYADADDNEKPVQPATPTEGQAAPQS